MGQLITGRLELSLVGKHGKSTSVLIDGTEVAALYGTNKSVLLMVWIASDMAGMKLLDCLKLERGKCVLPEGFFLSILDAKYDPVVNHSAVLNAYLNLMNTQGKENAMDYALSMFDAMILHVQKEFKFFKLDVELIINERELWT